MTQNTKDKKGGLTVQQIQAMSAVLQRSKLASALGKQFNGKRDIYEALGYQKNPKYDDYYSMYDRQDIAGRLIDMPSSATWRNEPDVVETDDEEKNTPFEQAWGDLSDRLRIWHYFERVDRLAGIGRYAVLVIGTKGETALNEPLLPNSLSSPDDILYVAPFSEQSAPVESFCVDPINERYGKPEYYKIDFQGDLRNEENKSTDSSTLVHHSRVLHIAEGLLEDEVYGRPRLKRVLNLLNDMSKVVGGSAEMFWQGAFKGLHASIDADADFDPSGVEAERLTEEIDEYIHGLRRYIRTRGMDITQLTGETPDPSGIFDVLVSLIAGASGIPKRMLLGAERGELASSQDEINFNANIAERQQHFAEPLVLRPFIDRLIEYGALPEPKEPYEILWPNLFALSEVEIADLALKRADTLTKYANSPMSEEIMPIPEFRRELMGLEGLPSNEDLKHFEDRLNEEYGSMTEFTEEEMKAIRDSLNDEPQEDEDEEEEE